MKSIFRARFNAYTLALAHLKEHEALTSNVSAVADICNEAKKLLDEFEMVENRSAERQTAPSLSKTNMHQELADEAYSVAVMIRSYASATGDDVLAERVSYTPTLLNRATANDLQSRAAVILQKANELAEQLKPYGLSTDRIKAFASLLTAFNTGKLAPREYIAERKEANKQAEELINRLTEIFDRRLDGLVFQFRKSEPEFYNQYLIKRTYVKPGRRKTQIEGTITDKASGAPVEGVTITVKGTAITTQSDADGSYHLYSAPFTGMLVVYEKEGYRTLEKDTTLQRGKSTRQPVVMEKM